MRIEFNFNLIFFYRYDEIVMLYTISWWRPFEKYTLNKLTLFRVFFSWARAVYQLQLWYITVTERQDRLQEVQKLVPRLYIGRLLWDGLHLRCRTCCLFTVGYVLALGLSNKNLYDFVRTAIGLLFPQSLSIVQRMTITFDNKYEWITLCVYWV